MARLKWETTKKFLWKDFNLPCAEELNPIAHPEAGYSQQCGIRPTSEADDRKKRLLWPLSQAKMHVTGTGFVHRQLGRLIEKYSDEQTDFLELGCGPMSLRKYLKKGTWYNGVDIAFSEFQLNRLHANPDLANIAIASATQLPLADGSVSMIASAEVLYCIPEIDTVFAETRRVLRKGGTMICSIANSHYHKYVKLGPHPDCRNQWRFQELIDHVGRFGFRSLDAIRIGYWVPITRPRALQSIWLPIKPKEEYYTSHFIYAFQKE